MVNWVEHLPEIEQRLNDRETLQSIGESFGVTRQRMYQVLTKFGIETTDRHRNNWLRGLSVAQYWLNRVLYNKGVSRKDREIIVKSLPLPEVCPILGHTLVYEGDGRLGWHHADTCPSIDRIDPTGKYVLENIHVISLRANKIKFNATPDELMKIAVYIEELTSARKN